MTYRQAPILPLCARCRELAVGSCPRCHRPLCRAHRRCSCADVHRPRRRASAPSQSHLGWRERLAELTLLMPLLGLALSVLVIAVIGLLLPVVAVLRI